MAGLAACLTGCSPLDVVNFASGSANYRLAEDVAYGTRPRQTLDLYGPSEANPNGCRIVFVYGGNWRQGDKRDYGFVGAAFARRGHEVAIPDYRLYPEVIFPDFVHDIALSVSWYQQRGDKRPLILMGHSAGGLIAALLSYDAQYLNAHEKAPDHIAALVTLAGPHDYFLPTDNQRWSAIFGTDAERQVHALPVRHVTTNAPPTLILHGADDGLVTPQSARSLASALEAHGVNHKLQIYPDIGHRRLVASIAPPLQFLAPTFNDVLHFIEQNICSATEH
jgi:acetyl esterase/lipase